MKKVYILTWVVSDSGYDGVHILGVFENEKEANTIRDQFREKDEFEGYYVNEYPVNAYTPDFWKSDNYVHLRDGKEE